MSEKYTIKEIAQFILVKFWIIAVSIIIISLLIGVPKAMQKQNVLDSNVLHVSAVIEYKNHAMYDSILTNTKEYQDYSDIWFRNPFLAGFVKQISSKYEMGKVYSKWNSVSDDEKMNWLREVFISNPMKNTPNYEINLTLAPSIINYDYVYVNAPKIFDDFITYATDSTKILSANSTSTKLSYSYIAQGTSPSKLTIIKYFIIGGFLGFILGGLFLLLVFLFGKKVVSKTLYKNTYRTDVIDEKNNIAYKVFCFVANKADKLGNNIVLIYSSAKSESLMSDVYQQITAGGYSVKFINASSVTQKLVDMNSNKKSKTPDITDQSVNTNNIPGKLKHNIFKLKQNYDFVFMFCDDPKEDPISLEILDSCACVLLFEKIYVSSRVVLDNTLSIIKKENTDIPTCIVWDN